MTEKNKNQDDLQGPIENNAAAYVARGVAYSSKGEYDLAIKAFNKAIELDPNNVDAYIRRGNVYGSKGEYDLAIKDFDKAIALDPNNADAYRMRGIEYGSKSEYDLAINDFNKAIELGFNDTYVYMERGIAYHSKGNYDLAIKDFDKAIELDPNNMDAYVWRGIAYRSKGNHDLAIKDFDKAIELEPDNVGNYAWRGLTYLSKNEYDPAITDPAITDFAITDFAKAIELEPNKADNYEFRGFTYLKKDDYNHSLSDFGEAERLNPSLKSESPYIYIQSRLKSITDNDLRIKSFQYCTDLFGIIDNLKNNLLEPNIVTHYTSLGVLKKLLSGEQFRLYNATYMNDPEEGETFFAILSNKEGGIDIKEKFYENSVNSYSPAYIGSFTKVDDSEKEDKKEDKLFLWRTYGKQENKEAGGACLIFESPCFSENAPSSFGAMPMQGGISDQETPTKPCLYQVVYQQEEDDDNRREILQNMAAKLRQINTECLEKGNNNKEKESIRELVRELLDEIRFLFKAEHYREEKEMRVVLMRYIPMDETPLNSDIKEDADHFPPRFYLDAPEGFHFDKVLLGPRALGLTQWQQWARVKPRGQDISIEKSKIPYRNS